jgi:hypothetical protein
MDTGRACLVDRLPSRVYVKEDRRLITCQLIFCATCSLTLASYERIYSGFRAHTAETSLMPQSQTNAPEQGSIECRGSSFGRPLNFYKTSHWHRPSPTKRPTSSPDLDHQSCSPFRLCSRCTPTSSRSPPSWARLPPSRWARRRPRPIPR